MSDSENDSEMYQSDLESSSSSDADYINDMKGSLKRSLKYADSDSSDSEDDLIYNPPVSRKNDSNSTQVSNNRRQNIHPSQTETQTQSDQESEIEAEESDTESDESEIDFEEYVRNTRKNKEYSRPFNRPIKVSQQSPLTPAEKDIKFSNEVSQVKIPEHSKYKNVVATVEKHERESVNRTKYSQSPPPPSHQATQSIKHPISKSILKNHDPQDTCKSSRRLKKRAKLAEKSNKLMLDSSHVKEHFPEFKSNILVPPYVYDILSKHKTSLKDCGFAIVKNNILKTMLNAYKSKKVDINADLSMFISDVLDQLGILVSCPPSYLKCYCMELVRYKNKLLLNCGQQLKDESTSSDISKLPKPTPLAINWRDLELCLYPDWLKWVTTVKKMIQSSNTQFTILYLLTCFYQDSSQLRLLEKYYQRIVSLSDTIKRQFQIDILKN